MKPLLIFLLALFRISSFAMTDFEVNLSKEFDTFSGSRNFEERYINDDGSVSIVKPQFSNPAENKDLYISQKSNFNGLCKLYGLGSYIPNSSQSFHVDPYSSVVRINLEGHFSQFDKSQDYKAVLSFSCTSADGMPYSDLASGNYLGPFYNDDGSITILKPKFKINGYDLHISEFSNLNGLCKLYGFVGYVSNSKKSFTQVESGSPVKIGSAGFVVKINSEGHFSRFDSSSDNKALESLMCY